MIHPRRCKHHGVGRTEIFVGDDAGPEPEHLRRFEGIGSRDQIGGEAARQEIARRTSQNPDIKDNKTASSNVLVVRMNVDYGCERILTNCARLRGRKGEDAIWPSNFFDQRPGIGVWQTGQSPCGVSLYFLIEYP